MSAQRSQKINLSRLTWLTYRLQFYPFCFGVAFTLSHSIIIVVAVVMYVGARLVLGGGELWPKQMVRPWDGSYEGSVFGG